MFEIHEGAGRPDVFYKLFAADRLTRVVEQCRQYAERLILNAEPYAMLPQHRFSDVQCKRSESDYSGWRPRHFNASLALRRAARA